MNTSGYSSVKYTVDAVVLAEHDDKLSVLLVRRGANSDAYPGYWALPGGHVDADETGLTAAYRELREETGLDLHALGATLTLVDIFDDPKRDPRGRVIASAYTTRLPHPTTVTGADDVDKAEWLALDKAIAADLAFDHHDILVTALDRHTITT